MLRKCKQCNWLTANDTYSFCHACGGELQEYKIPKLKIRPTQREIDAGDSVEIPNIPNAGAVTNSDGRAVPTHRQ